MSSFTTEEEVTEFLAQEADFKRRCLDIAVECSKIKHHTQPYSDDLTDYEWVIGPDGIEITWSGYQHSDSEYYSVMFPTRYLWQEGWQDELRAEVAERERKRKEEEKVKQKNYAENNKKQRRQLYEELKREFGE